MARFTDPRDLLSHQRRRFERTGRSMQVGMEGAVGEIKQEAYNLVSGDISSQTLAAYGHPFGKGASARAGCIGDIRISVNPLPINVQSGELRKSLRVFRRQRGGETIWQVQFTSSHSIVTSPDGTPTMIGRGFWTTLNQFAQPLLAQRLREAKRAGEGG